MPGFVSRIVQQRLSASYLFQLDSRIPFYNYSSLDWSTPRRRNDFELQSNHVHRQRYIQHTLVEVNSPAEVV